MATTEQPTAFASTVPLAIYAAIASSRLRTLGVTAPGATIALAGGLIWLIVAGFLKPLHPARKVKPCA